MKQKVFLQGKKFYGSIFIIQIFKHLKNAKNAKFYTAEKSFTQQPSQYGQDISEKKAPS